MKVLLFSVLFSLQLFAYQIGDTIADKLLKTLEIKEDKAYLIDFFASWCGSCKKEIPLISEVNKKLDHNKVLIIGVDVDRNINDAINFQKTLKENKTLNFKVINDPQNTIVSAFHPIGMPTLYYVKNKKVVSILTGAIDNIDKQILHDLEKMELK